MQPGRSMSLNAAAWIIACSLIAGTSRADEAPSRLGRLFRLGGGPAAPATPRSTRPGASADLPPPPATPDVGKGSTLAPRLVPQPRVSRPVTDADPILTRISIGRADTGARFGLFIEIFADGTVLDSEGVHRVDREALQPLIRAIQAADPSRLKGHCGGPPTDFIEQVHLIVYERSLRGLRANAISYSGNPQGCDPAVRNLQAAIDAFQARLSGFAPTSQPAATPDAPPPPPVDPTTIPLTPDP